MVLSILQKTFLKLAGIGSIVALLFIIGTITYHNLEGWTYADSFYFTGVTLTTIGYGDLHPTTNTSKIFTVFFALSGIGIVLAVITIISQYFFQQEKLFRDKLDKDIIKQAMKLREKQKNSMQRIKRKIISGSKL
ncbi:MAG: potassium channel family protein [Candidatus Aenigmatarchaeota archaeon]